MASSEVILSVGIDVGTTTTQLMFSRLELVNRAAVSQVPQYEFSKRDILYQSPVVLTPIDAVGGICQEELLTFILQQYARAGVTQQQIHTGAIIITGETSKARNARSTVLSLAETLGDFVVATAGPHLESIIAGRGSGAAEFSRGAMQRVLNIDIGGGTANYALFDEGRVAASACLNVGGRLLETSLSGAVVSAHAPGLQICQALLGNACDPRQLTGTQLVQVTDLMADLLYQVASGQLSPLAQELLMTEPLPPGSPPAAVMISGGVGECLLHPVSPQELFRFQDIGPLLAESVRRHPGFATLPLVQAKQNVRATVIGAGAHTLSLSGSTIWLKALPLPLRNIPVIHAPAGQNALLPGGLLQGWQQGLRHQDLQPQQDLYALALPETVPVAYQAILHCVQELSRFNQLYTTQHPLLILAKQDLGKALGMLLQPHTGNRLVAVIDEVATREGDYIDIGHSLFGGEIVPVTVKSLAFPS